MVFRLAKIASYPGTPPTVYNIDSIAIARNVFDKASIQCIECEFCASKS